MNAVPILCVAYRTLSFCRRTIPGLGFWSDFELGRAVRDVRVHVERTLSF